jgi:hypothetical protein
MKHVIAADIHSNHHSPEDDDARHIEDDLVAVLPRGPSTNE